MSVSDNLTVSIKAAFSGLRAIGLAIRFVSVSCALTKARLEDMPYSVVSALVAKQYKIGQELEAMENG